MEFKGRGAFERCVEGLVGEHIYLSILLLA